MSDNWPAANSITGAAAFVDASGHESVIILLLACLALESVNIWRILTAHVDQNSPPGPSAALRYKPSSNLALQFLPFLWHLFHMLLASVSIVMCRRKCYAFHGATTRDKVIGLTVAFGIPVVFNVFLALTARAIT